jgi:hypothetical protein
MSKEYGGPHLIKEVRKNPGDLLEIGKIAEAVSYPGENKKRVADRLRWYMNQGYLTPVARETMGRKAWLFLPSECLVAELLARLNEFGVAEKKAAQAVTIALSHWRKDDCPEGKPHVSPGMHVIKQYEDGHRDWNFELWLFSNPQTGKTHFEGRIAANQRQEGTTLTFTANKEYEARGVFAVDLVQVLDRIHPSRRAERAALN